MLLVVVLAACPAARRVKKLMRDSRAEFEFLARSSKFADDYRGAGELFEHERG